MLAITPATNVPWPSPGDQEENGRKTQLIACAEIQHLEPPIQTGSLPPSPGPTEPRSSRLDSGHPAPSQTGGKCSSARQPSLLTLYPPPTARDGETFLPKGTRAWVCLSDRCTGCGISTRKTVLLTHKTGGRSEGQRPGHATASPPTVVQCSLVGPVGSLLHVFEVGVLLAQPSVKNSNPHVSA